MDLGLEAVEPRAGGAVSDLEDHSQSAEDGVGMPAVELGELAALFAGAESSTGVLGVVAAQAVSQLEELDLAGEFEGLGLQGLDLGFLVGRHVAGAVDGELDQLAGLVEFLRPVPLQFKKFHGGASA